MPQTTSLILNYRQRRTSDCHHVTIVPLNEMRAAAAAYRYGPASKCGAKCDGYTCTRENGHEGRHAAHLTMERTADSVGATWE